MSDDTYSMTVKLQRGTSTDDRDTQKVTVTAETIDELAERVEEVREKMEGWATDFRDIQPDPMGPRDTADDQAELSEVGP